MKALLVICGLLSLAAPLKAEVGPNTFLQIYSHTQRPDYDSPWRKPEVRTFRYMGTLLEGNRILVSAFAITYSGMIEGSRFGDSHRFPLKIEAVDHTANLALLTAEDPKELEGMKPIELGPLVPLNEQLSLITGTEERVVPLPVRLRDVDVRRGGTSPYLLTHYNLEVRQTSGLGWAEPVVQNDKLVGLAVGQSGAIVYALPTKVMNHFFTDLESNDKRGFARLGISWRSLRSPYARAYFKASKEKQGVVVTEVAENSPFHGQVQPNDILLAVAGTPINDKGYYQHPLWGRMHFVDKVSEFFGGDEIKLAVLREGKPLEFQARLEAYDPYSEPIPEIRDQEPYLIFGGFLFQELSKGFLEAWGDDWTSTAPDHLVYLWTFKNKPKKARRQRYVVLNRVLADDHNKGYEKLSNVIVEKVNGLEVESLADVVEALKLPITKGKETYAVFEFGYWGGTAVISYQSLDKSHVRIAKNYGISSEENFFQFAFKHH